MDAPISTPAFEARRLSSASGWYVRAAWPNGKRDHIPGFVSRLEAERWIAEKAQAWLSMQPPLAVSEPLLIEGNFLAGAVVELGGALAFVRGHSLARSPAHLFRTGAIQ